MSTLMSFLDWKFFVFNISNAFFYGFALNVYLLSFSTNEFCESHRNGNVWPKALFLHPIVGWQLEDIF